jgi:uncharacterized protein YbjQ (UPF0145 family)
MSLARGEAARETAPEVAQPSAFTAAVETAPTLLLSLQRTVGNAAVSRWVLARQPAPAGAKGAAAVAKVGVVGGTRPTITETSKTFDDCNAAVAWVNSGTYIGEAEPIYAPTASKPRVKKLADGTYQAEVDFTWAVDASSKAEVIVPTWPNMTKDDKAAVARFKSALRAHEVMHFDVTDKVIKALPKTVKATGSDGQDAMTNLQTEADTYGANAKTAIDTATTDYDNTTGHGKTQDAVGGVNVELNCP